MIQEIVETLRQWDEMFYSESETKWVMNKAPDMLERMAQNDGNL